ncbi:MAG: peptidase M4 family protein, partial [Chloroflexi bacterium]|nr:peptidase M4 family protein [Chloroflexota bacterium]
LGLLVATVSIASAQSNGRGRLQSAYVERGGARPAWVTDALERSLRQLENKGKSRVSFKLRAAQQDDLATHVRLDQLYRGLPVFGGQLIAHLDSRGNPRSENGRFYEGLNLNTTPSLTAAQAIAAATKALGYKGSFAEAPSARLLVLPQAGGAVLTYQVGLLVEDGTNATGNYQYFINALDGSVALSYNSIDTVHTTGTGNTLYSGTVSLGTEQTDGVYELRDTTRGDMQTVDLNNHGGGNGKIFTDLDNIWGDGTNSNDQSAAADAHFGAAQTWDYYLNTYGRRGIDGEGFQIISRVHYGKDYNNAFWNGKVMTYGDGSGTLFTPLVALDVAGHEITHGVTTMTADLIYAGESGALNESFSDIFGTAVEFYTGGVGGRTPDYYIGEDIYVPADVTPGFRNMQDPAEDNDPNHYSVRLFPEPCKPSGKNDSCGVHSNSGIQNHAFYLLAEGGTNAVSGLSVSGIGRQKAEAIFYRALTSYLFPSATFSDARAASLSAAADLYGANSPEYNATAQTWTAVGVQ